MKKFFSLSVIMSLIFFFAIPALASDVKKVDLASNLSFTFERSSTMEKSLILVPFADFDFTPLQEEPIKVKKDDSLLPVFALGVALVLIFCLEQEYKF